MDKEWNKEWKPLRKSISDGDISADKIHYTPDGFIETRYFWKTPDWVIESNRDKEISLTKEYKKYPEGTLGKIAKQISRFEGYETFRDIFIEPEKYRNPVKILQRYIQEIKSPQVDWRLKGYFNLFKRYTARYPIPPGMEEEEAKKLWEEKVKGIITPGYFKYKTLWADMTDEDKQKGCDALNQYYQLRGEDKKVKPSDLKEEGTLDLINIVGLGLEMSPLNPANLIFKGLGAIGRKAISPVKASLMQKGMKTTLGASANKIFRKVYVSQTINQLGDEGVTAMQRVLARSDDLIEAETKFLNIYRPGWQGLMGTPKEITKLPSLVDRFVEKISKRPTGQKALQYFGKKFARGYGETLQKDFISRIKSLGIKRNSWEEMMVRNMLNAKHPEDYMKHLVGLTDEMVEAYNLTRQYNKQVLAIEQIMGYPNIKEVQNYLYRLYIETPGKPMAYNIGREIGADKPIVAYNRLFETVDDARRAGYIVADGFIDPMIARLKIHADMMAKQGYLQALKDTYGELYKKDTFLKTREAVKELSEKGMRKVRGVKELKDYMFDNRLATILERQVRPLNNIDQWAIKFNKIVMSPVKKIWTFTTGFHIRNFMGSHFQNATEYGWGKVLNPKKQIEASKLAWTTEEFGVTIGEQTYKASAIRNLFDLSGLGAGWYRGELMGGQTMMDRAWSETMGKAGDLTERQVRMFSLVEGLRQTDNYIDACLLTKLLHFDYLDSLTQVEKIYGRAIVPFFTWKRFNAPLQVYFLGTQTTRVANVFRTVRTMGLGEPSKIPLWFNQYLMGKIGTYDASTKIQKYLKLDIPLAQIGLLTPTYEALMEDKDLNINQRFVKFLSPFVAETNPIIKLAFELATNFDTFRVKEIGLYKVKSPLPDIIVDSFPDFLKNKFELEKDKEGYWIMNPYWAKILEQIPGLYQLSISVGYEKYPDYKKQKWLYDQLSMIGGIKIYPVDVEYYSKLSDRQINQLKKRKKEYERRVKKLQKVREKEKVIKLPSEDLIKTWKPLRGGGE